MLNKIYVKVINYIKEEYKFLIILFFIIFLGLYHLPYNLYMGGGLIDIANRLEIVDEYKEKGSFNMTYVKASQATIPTYLLSYLFDWERESINNLKLDENDNTKDMWQRDLIYLQEANDNAIICAYTKAGANITIKKEVLEVLYIDKESDTNLEIGDTIKKIGNETINSFDELKNKIEQYNYLDKVEVTIVRDNKEMQKYFTVRNIDGEKKAGLYLVKLYDYDLDKPINLDFNNNEGGPSGGFMLSLAIYNRLVSDDLTKGKKIAGTGTIDKNGNIGVIGGIKYKVMGAYHGKADVFFVPVENYEEAMKVNEEKGYDLNIVKVATLDEAVEYLRRM